MKSGKKKTMVTLWSVLSEEFTSNLFYSMYYYAPNSRGYIALHMSVVAVHPSVIKLVRLMPEERLYFFKCVKEVGHD